MYAKSIVDVSLTALRLRDVLKCRIGFPGLAGEGMGRLGVESVVKERLEISCAERRSIS